MFVRGSDRSSVLGELDRGGDERRVDVGAILDTLPDGALARRYSDTAPPRVIGLDLGQASDYTALAVTDRDHVETGMWRATGEHELVAESFGAAPTPRPVIVPVVDRLLRLRHLQRWEIGTSYVTVVDEVAEIVGKLDEMHELETPESAKPVLVIDYTGVGRPVVDMFVNKRLPFAIVAVTTTGGDATRQDAQHGTWNEWSVPKKDLVAPLLVAVQNQRYKIAAELPDAARFATEMQAFRMKVSAKGGVTYEHEKATDHDDMVIAAALAAWYIDKINKSLGV